MICDIVKRSQTIYAKRSLSLVMSKTKIRVLKAHNNRIKLIFESIGNAGEFRGPRERDRILIMGTVL